MPRKTKTEMYSPSLPFLSLSVSLSTFFLYLWLFFLCPGNKAKKKKKILQSWNRKENVRFNIPGAFRKNTVKSASTSHCFWFIIFLNWFLYQIKDQIIFLIHMGPFFFACVFTQYVWSVSTINIKMRLTLIFRHKIQ